ncbi:DUF992 domain-containing protein [Pikeienuella piscinae]|uniref:DUF992 domain-containing protein n=1 Tax=Pikeienuella piscinae TaxID=2748098 RepID=A0A7L5C0K7_9RHOB|nr:DUF992 domain-containing protein [Pikeienuella piscinae]QIE55684.1 DUF992 domain-containing protein [Pikeienuella piscinae]
MHRTMTTTITAVLLGATALAGAAQADETAAGANTDDEGRVEVGYLECAMVSDEGNILVSEQKFTCTFDPAEDGRADENYVATFSKMGLDLSKTDRETIRWAVLAPAQKYRVGVLEGEYAGISADAAVGAGVGAKALVGGLDESITLQPVSVTTQEGVGVSLAFESLTLTHVAGD